MILKLEDGRKVVLATGPAWSDACLDRLLLPLIEGNPPPGAERVASSAFTEVWKGSCGGDKTVIVKFFRPRGLKDLLPLRRSRARREMEGGEVLRAAGLGAPIAVAQGHVRQGFILQRAFLITEFLPGVFSTYAYMRALFSPPLAAEGIRSKRAFIAHAGKTIGKMHRQGIFHGDLRPGNMLIAESPQGPLLYFIDNERTRRFRGGLPDRLRMKNLVQMNMIVMPAVTFTDRLRFLNAYLSENPEHMPFRKDLASRVFLRTRERLQDRLPGIWHAGK